MSDFTPERMGSSPDVDALPLERDVDWALVEARQDDVDGILSRFPNSAGRRAKEISKLARRSHDQTGLSFLHILGAELPGLDLHGVEAKGIVISASDISGSDMRDANLEAAVFTASVMDGVQAERANFNLAVMPLARFRNGNLDAARAIDANLNLADLTDTSARGLSLASATLIGTEGIDALLVNLRAARVLGREQGNVSTSSIMERILSSSFLEAEEYAELGIDPVLVTGDRNLRDKMFPGLRAESTVWSGTVLSDARMPGAKLTGSIFEGVKAHGLVLRTARAAGMVILGSDLSESDATSLWLPGGFIAESSVKNARLHKVNMPGMVSINTDWSEADLSDANVGGSVFIGGNTPELNEAQRKQVSIVDAKNLPQSVIAGLQRIHRGSEMPQLGA